MPGAITRTRQVSHSPPRSSPPISRTWGNEHVPCSTMSGAAESSEHIQSITEVVEGTRILLKTIFAKTPAASLYRLSENSLSTGRSMSSLPQQRLMSIAQVHSAMLCQLRLCAEASCLRTLLVSLVNRLLSLPAVSRPAAPGAGRNGRYDSISTPSR